MAQPKFLLIDDCPVHYDVAPYVYLVLRRAGQPASSIYRGRDAEWLLHKLGKRSQREIHRDMPAISNPEGFSMHDLHSDGHAKVGPAGRRLQTWEVGIDSGGNDERSKRAIAAAAKHYGLVAYHPYSRGVEGHHWGFRVQPRVNPKLTKTRVKITRARLRAASYRRLH